MIPDLKALWDSFLITDLERFKQPVAAILAARDRYAAVAETTGVPWQVIGVIHQRECSGDFNCHLHNGDPLAARTVDEPAGRPTAGNPPFTWDVSAVDALSYDGFLHLDLWSDVPTALYRIERFNGLGYRSHNLLSPYIWAGTDRYTKGKYGSDGHFDPELVDQQPGCAGMLRLLSFGVVPNADPTPSVAPGGVVITPEFGAQETIS
jgi:lysozyme family protein